MIAVILVFWMICSSLSFHVQNMYPTGADDEQYAVFFHLKDIASHDMEWGMISVGFQYDRESVDLELEFHKQPRYLDHVKVEIPGRSGFVTAMSYSERAENTPVVCYDADFQPLFQKGDKELLVKAHFYRFGWNTLPAFSVIKHHLMLFATSDLARPAVEETLADISAVAEVQH